MNSTSATFAPARSARATPSPVDTDGFVVCANTCPSPPVASTTAHAIACPTPSRVPAPITCNVTPQTAPFLSLSASSTSASSTTSISGSSLTADKSARETSAPVASPPACKIRLRK